MATRSAHRSVALPPSVLLDVSTTLEWHWEKVAELVAESTAELYAWKQEPSRLECLDKVRRSLTGLASVVAAMPAAATADERLQPILRTIRDVSYAGGFVHAARQEDLRLLEPLQSRGGLKLLSTLLIAPPWQYQHAVGLEGVPHWLWETYLTWTLSPPLAFVAPGASTAFSSNAVRALTELAAWTERNPGSSAVQAGLRSYFELSARLAHGISDTHQLDCSKARARILARSTPRPDGAIAAANPIEGRKQRVGVIGPNLEPSRRSLSLLSLLGHLDVNRFEVLLYLSEHTESAVESQLLCHGARRAALTGTTPDEMKSCLRAADLDVAIFLPSESASLDPNIGLCVQRIATLQWVHDCGAAIFLENSDLTLRGEWLPELPVLTKTRVALLPGLGVLTINSLASMPPENWTRQALTLPDEAFVCLSVLDKRILDQETRQAWADFLASAPDARLIILADDVPEVQLTLSCSLISETLTASGVDSSRVTVIPCSVFTQDERRAYVRIADVLWDVPSDVSSEWSIAALQESVLPLSLQQSIRPAALLTKAGLSELVAVDAASQAQIASELATDRNFRATLQRTSLSAVRGIVAHHHPVVQSAAFGELLVSVLGSVADPRPEVRRENRAVVQSAIADITPILEEANFFLELGAASDAAQRAYRLVASSPESIDARRTLGRALSAAGQHTQAMDVFVSAIELAPDDPHTWHELALAAWKGGRNADACDALQSALRIDSARVDSWILFGRIAKQAGHQEFLSDALSVLRQLAPDNEELAELAAP